MLLLSQQIAGQQLEENQLSNRTQTALDIHFGNENQFLSDEQEVLYYKSLVNCRPGIWKDEPL